MTMLFMIGLIMLVIGVSIIKNNIAVGTVLIVLGGAFLSAVGNIYY